MLYDNAPTSLPCMFPIYLTSGCKSSCSAGLLLIAITHKSRPRKRMELPHIHVVDYTRYN